MEKMLLFEVEALGVCDEFAETRLYSLRASVFARVRMTARVLPRSTILSYGSRHASGWLSLIWLKHCWK